VVGQDDARVVAVVLGAVVVTGGAVVTGGTVVTGDCGVDGVVAGRGTWLWEVLDGTARKAAASAGWAGRPTTPTAQKVTTRPADRTTPIPVGSFQLAVFVFLCRPGIR
jgi:hypothetical protein